MKVLMITSKKCSACGVEKAASEFYENKHTKSGLASQCKECAKRAVGASEWKKRRREGRRENLRATIDSRGKIRCRVCKKRYLPDEMAKQYTRTTENAPEYQTICKICDAAKRKRRREEKKKQS